MPRHRSRSRSRSRSPARHSGKERDNHNRNFSKRDFCNDRDSSRKHGHHCKTDGKDDKPTVKSEPQRNYKKGPVKSEQQTTSQFPMKAQDIQWGKKKYDEKGKESNEPKEKPSFETSGKLLEDTNTFRGRVIKYNEPPEAMKPRKRWRIYPFKGDEALPVMYVHRQSAYLIGSDRVVADFPVDHPSCSKQHAVLQYRKVPHVKPDGTNVHVVRPYVIDLDSTNGTYLNGERVQPRRYYELKEKDVMKFGYSSREYVMLHEKSDTSEQDDELVVEPSANE